jgi:hypothetical protein
MALDLPMKTIDRTYNLFGYEIRVRIESPRFKRLIAAASRHVDQHADYREAQTLLDMAAKECEHGENDCEIVRTRTLISFLEGD